MGNDDEDSESHCTQIDLCIAIIKAINVMALSQRYLSSYKITSTSKFNLNGVSLKGEGEGEGEGPSPYLDGSSQSLS